MGDDMSEVIELQNGGTGQVQAKDKKTSVPKGIVQESWVGWWVNWKSISIHDVLDDMFFAKGGCKGEIRDGTNPAQTGNNDDGYSFLIPYSTELQWRTRVLLTPYTNHYKRFIMSQIRPVYSQGNISYKAMLAETDKKDDVFHYFIKNASGTGVSYRDMSIYAAQERKIHDVAYYIMTKAVGAEIPSLTVRSSVDFLSAEGDKNGVLISITFYNGKKIVKNKTVATAERWFMEDGICYFENLEGDWDGNKSCFDDIEWEVVEGPISTEVKEMVVKAHLIGAQPRGEFLPRYPESVSIAMACMSYFQGESKHAWLMTLTRLPIPYVFSKSGVRGMRAGGSQIWDIRGDSTGYPSPPGFMSVDSSLATVSAQDLSAIKQDISDIARESGVNTGSANSASQQSGESKSFDFIATEVKLQETVKESQAMNEWVYHMFNIYTGRGDSWTYEAIYPTSFFPEEPKSVDEVGTMIDKADQFGMNELAKELILFAGRDILKNTVSDERMKEIIQEVQSSAGGRVINE